MELDWQRLFPDGDFRHPLALRPGDAHAFFASEDDTLLDERRRWIDDPNELGRYVATDFDATESIHEFASELLDNSGVFLSENPTFAAAYLGRFFEPDWVVLREDASGVRRVIAGAICFPSGWALQEKMGGTLDEIHAPVPGLNAALARPITSFFTKLAPQKSWARENWGLSADTELNHHPARSLPQLTADATLESAWLRLERQVLYKLPRTSAVVFGIRVTHHALDDFRSEPEAAARLARALMTMPEDVAVYKGVASARAALIEQLQAADGTRIKHG